MGHPSPDHRSRCGARGEPSGHRGQLKLCAALCGFGAQSLDRTRTAPPISQVSTCFGIARGVSLGVPPIKRKTWFLPLSLCAGPGLCGFLTGYDDRGGRS